MTDKARKKMEDMYNGIKGHTELTIKEFEKLLEKDFDILNATDEQIRAATLGGLHTVLYYQLTSQTVITLSLVLGDLTGIEMDSLEKLFDYLAKTNLDNNYAFSRMVAMMSEASNIEDSRSS